MRSVESPFQFLSFKIDKFSFNLADDLGLLINKGEIQSSRWKYILGFRQPQFFIEEKVYVGGLVLDMTLPGEVKHETEEVENLISLHAEIGGVFRCENGKLKKELELRLVKNQIPAILMPYLRSAITGFLASAGYGTIILPLININALAERDLKDVDILEIN